MMVMIAKNSSRPRKWERSSGASGSRNNTNTNGGKMAVRPWINLTKTTKNSTKPARVRNRLSTDDFSRIKTSLIALQTYCSAVGPSAAGCAKEASRTTATLGKTQLFLHPSEAIQMKETCGVVA